MTANRVINCCGFHGRDVGLLAGLDLPLVPVQHQYLVTKSVPEIQALDKEIPVLRHLEGSFYLRQERDGLLIGPYESQSAMVQMETWTRQGELEGGRNCLRHCKNMELLYLHGTMHTQYFTLINLNLKLQFLPPSNPPWSPGTGCRQPSARSSTPGTSTDSGLI